MTLDDFVAYLQEYIVPSKLGQQKAFRDGFLAGFGANAEEIYDRAMQTALSPVKN